MNKKISTGAGIVVVAAAAIIVVGAIWFAQIPAKDTVPTPVKNTATKDQQASAQKTKDQSCLNSGGTIAASSCCQSASDFPNSCAIGACGCAPASSHQIKACDCGAGKCFDGNSCADIKSTTSETTNQLKQAGPIYKNTQYGFQLTLPKGWEKYKTNIDNSDGISYIFFFLPTTDKYYPDPDKGLKGYADIFSIDIWQVKVWNKKMNSPECKIEGDSLDCPTPDSVLAKNNFFVFVHSFSNGAPDDLRNIQQQMIDSHSLKKNFKLL